MCLQGARHGYLAGQVHGFAAAIAAGLTLGLFFDLYRLWRRAARPGEGGHRFVRSSLLAGCNTGNLHLPIDRQLGRAAVLRVSGLFLGLFLYFSVLSIIVLMCLDRVLHECCWEAFCRECGAPYASLGGGRPLACQPAMADPAGLWASGYFSWRRGQPAGAWPQGACAPKSLFSEK